MSSIVSEYSSEAGSSNTFSIHPSTSVIMDDSHDPNWEDVVRTSGENDVLVHPSTTRMDIDPNPWDRTSVPENNNPCEDSPGVLVHDFIPSAPPEIDLSPQMKRGRGTDESVRVSFASRLFLVV